MKYTSCRFSKQVLTLLRFISFFRDLCETKLRLKWAQNTTRKTKQDVALFNCFNLSAKCNIPFKSFAKLLYIKLWYSECSCLFPLQYIFVDTKHKVLFVTVNDFNTITRVSVSFSADEIKYHASNADVVLAYDRTASPKKVKL